MGISTIIQPRPAGRPTDDSRPADRDFIRLVSLSKAYQEEERRRVVLDNASAGFGRGEFVALLGRSGSGKSTLLNLVSGIDRPDAGQVWVGDQELTALSERDRTLFRRRQIGFIFQFFNLIPTLTVLENVTLPLELGGAEPNSAQAAAEPLLVRSGCWSAARPTRIGSPAASSSGRRSPAPSRTIRSSCWPTNRPATWTKTHRPAGRPAARGRFPQPPRARRADPGRHRDRARADRADRPARSH
jgi:ABC-type sugar transport system ATPase subunit